MATLWDYQRQLRRVAASRNQSAVQALRQVYADVLQQLQGILGKYYTAYGSGTESTLSQADLRLAGQYQSFLYDVQKQLDGLSAPVQSRIRQTIADTYTLCYDGMAAAVRQAAQGNRTLQEALRGLSDTTPETVWHLVEHPMQELTLSDVFQRQRSRVIREIKKTLTTGLAVGDSYTKMSQAIADVLGGDLAKAQRIVRTEAHRAISRGFQDVSDQTAYLLRESPYMEVKEWCSAEDGDVRSAHRKLDGVVLPVAEEFEVDGRRAACPCGFGVAELDINCRCFLKYSLVLRSEFEGKRHKAKQEQPAAKNTPQVQAGQMTLSTASGQQTPAHAVEVQPTAPPEDGGMGEVYLPEKIEYMSRFTPRYSDQTTFTSGKVHIKVKRVANSHYQMYTDVDADRKNKAVRLTEKALLAIQPELPEGFQIPKIAVVDFQKHRLNPSENKIAIAGYDKITNTMYVNNIYDSSEKVLEYVNRLPGWFANTTEQAPFLHELGHKFYEDCIKRLAISEDIGYNESKKKIDRRIFNHIEEQHDSDFIRKFLSVYADKGWTSGEFTEIIAECFSVRGKNSVADAILALLG